MSTFYLVCVARNSCVYLRFRVFYFLFFRFLLFVFELFSFRSDKRFQIFFYCFVFPLVQLFAKIHIFERRNRRNDIIVPHRFFKFARCNRQSNRIYIQTRVHIRSIQLYTPVDLDNRFVSVGISVNAVRLYACRQYLNCPGRAQ